MPVIPGTMGIKSWSYELLVDTDNATIVCEDCLRAEGEDPESDAYHPIFADQEWDYAPSCDVCGYVTDIVTVLGGDE